MAPHQERVVAERDELEAKIEKLEKFCSPDNAIFMSLDQSEQFRLTLQYSAMAMYSAILSERIEAFK